MYLVIIVMASSTASVIGVSDLVARANIVIAAIGDDRLMLWVYGYAMLWFFLFCWPLSRLVAFARHRLERRSRRALAV
jgi:polar amino acid transport system permease protein